MKIPSLDDLLRQIDFKKNQKQVMVFLALLCVLAVVVYFNFILKPQVTGAFGAMVKMSKAGTDLKDARTAISNIPKFQNDISAYKEKVDSYERMLPAEQEIPTLLENLSDIAKRSGVKIESILPVASKEEKLQASHVYQEIPILITAKSGYHEIGAFLSRLESSERFMKVVDIEVRSNKFIPRRHEVELLVLTYILIKGR